MDLSDIEPPVLSGNNEFFLLSLCILESRSNNLDLICKPENIKSFVFASESRTFKLAMIRHTLKGLSKYKIGLGIPYYDS